MSGNCEVATSAIETINSKGVPHLCSTSLDFAIGKLNFPRLRLDQDRSFARLPYRKLNHWVQGTASLRNSGRANSSGSFQKWHIVQLSVINVGLTKSDNSPDAAVHQRHVF